MLIKWLARQSVGTENAASSGIELTMVVNKYRMVNVNIADI